MDCRRAVIHRLALTQNNQTTHTHSFGVTPEYLMNAKQIEIKMAQGAKPGTPLIYLHIDVSSTSYAAHIHTYTCVQTTCRRGRPAARQEDRRVYRGPALLQAGRHSHLAPAPPRHLLHRGPSGRPATTYMVSCTWMGHRTRHPSDPHTTSHTTNTAPIKIQHTTGPGPAHLRPPRHQPQRRRLRQARR